MCNKFAYGVYISCSIDKTNENVPYDYISLYQFPRINRIFEAHYSLLNSHGNFDILAKNNAN